MAEPSAATTFRVERRDDLPPRLTLDLQTADGEPIRPRLFGNFLEHLGPSIQGGVLAQLLLNPTFFASPLWPNQNLPPADLAQLRENGVIAERLHTLDAAAQQAYAGWRPHLRVTGFGLMILDDESGYGIPTPWTVEPRGAGMGGVPGRIGQAVRLMAAGGQAVLAQGVFPPHQRERTYVGHLWARATGEGTLRVAFRRRSPARELLVESRLSWPGERWAKVEFSLTLPDESLRPLEPVDFCIVAEGGELWVDRALLLPDDAIDGLDPDMLEQIRRLAPPILRWPGGNFTSTYHFWDGIGPLDRRQTNANVDWGGIDDNFFGVNEFLRLCELVGTEPHLCVNIGNGTPEEAAAWVEYVNGAADTHWGALRAADGHPAPYGVRLWAVGNEIYGPWQTGHCGADENALRYRTWAEAMLAVDPSLELLATGSCFEFTGPRQQWHEVLLEEGGPHVSSIALHMLPGNANRIDRHGNLVQLWEELMAVPQRWETVDLPGLVALAQQLAPDRAIDVAITEWGILGETQRPQVGNLGGAIFAALFLNMAIRRQEIIRVANATALLHGGCLRRAGPFLYQDPQIEVIRRYTGLSGGARLPVAYQGPGYDLRAGEGSAPAALNIPWLDAVAVRRADGEITVAVVNRHAHAALDVTLEIAGGLPLTPRSFEIMTGHIRQMNTPLAPESVVFQLQPCPPAGSQLTLHLPPRAIGWLHGLAGA